MEILIHKNPFKLDDPECYIHNRYGKIYMSFIRWPLEFVNLFQPLSLTNAWLIKDEDHTVFEKNHHKQIFELLKSVVDPHRYIYLML